MSMKFLLRFYIFPQNFSLPRCFSGKKQRILIWTPSHGVYVSVYERVRLSGGENIVTFNVEFTLRESTEKLSAAKNFWVGWAQRAVANRGITKMTDRLIHMIGKPRNIPKCYLEYRKMQYES